MMSWSVAAERFGLKTVKFPDGKASPNDSGDTLPEVCFTGPNEITCAHGNREFIRASRQTVAARAWEDQRAR